MKFKFLNVSVLFLLIIFLQSCLRREMMMNRENAEKLRIGMSREEVIDIMGPPPDEEFNEDSELLYYYYYHKWYDGMLTKDECIPLIFKDGKLAAWGLEYYQQEYLLPKWRTAEEHEKEEDLKIKLD